MKYKIWDKKEDIYTLGRDPKTGKSHFTASEWIERNQWIAVPGSKVIISDGPINGRATLEFYDTKEQYKKMGAKITDEMTDEEVLEAMEDFDDNPPLDNEASTEERIAAALEAQVMMSEPDSVVVCMDNETMVSDYSIGNSSAYNRIKRNYDLGLWGRELVVLSVQKGRITMKEMSSILEE